MFELSEEDTHFFAGKNSKNFIFSVRIVAVHYSLSQSSHCHVNNCSSFLTYKNCFTVILSEPFLRIGSAPSLGSAMLGTAAGVHPSLPRSPLARDRLAAPISLPWLEPPGVRHGPPGSPPHAYPNSLTWRSTWISVPSIALGFFYSELSNVALVFVSIWFESIAKKAYNISLNLYLIERNGSWCFGLVGKELV
jgi:hypothetical protein